MKRRKAFCMALGIVMVFSLLFARPASAAAYSDTAGHWAESAIDRWSGYGVVRGSAGAFRPDGRLNRAEAATILDDLLGLTETEGAEAFIDVPSDAWYADAMAKASAAGILKGVGGNRADPFGEVTRETFFVMFARGLGLSPQDATKGAQADGSAWSEGYINALTDRGYVRGDGTGVRALDPMTRASVMSLLDQTVSTYVNEDGAAASASGEGITLVAAKNVTLSGKAGDVIVVSGASGGTLTLKDATVDALNLAEGAKNVNLCAERTAKIGTVNTLAAGTTVSGTGKIDKLVGSYKDERTKVSSGGGSSGGSGGGTTSYVYALMNIPYGEFYAAEGAADAVSSATRNGKARNVNVNGASYHESVDAVTTEGIAGVMYPVRATASQLSALKQLGAAEVTDSTEPVSYEMSARGQTTTVTLEGRDILQESPRYSYYVLSETPASCKTLNVSGETVTFGKAAGTSASGTASGEVTVGGRHADIEISLSGIEVEPKAVSAVTVTTADGAAYALHHVVNIWRGTEIGWNLSDLDLGGKTITNVRYYCKDGTITYYAASIDVAKAGYVLMNIPYDEFYAGEGVEGVDAVTSATKMKPRTGTLAGGSYHVNADGSDITGVTYPVFVKDWSVLDGLTQITDESSVDITVTNRGTETTTTYSGQDALFEAPSHAYYVLADKPARYKTLTVENDTFTFGAVSGRAATVSDVEPSVVYHSHHNNFIEITLNGVTFGETENVSGAVVTMESGRKLALRHITELWRKNCIGWADADGVAEETIVNVTFLTRSGKYSCDVSIPIKKDHSGVSAAFTAADSVTLSGLPEDIQNPAATVQSQVPRGETTVVIAENVPVTNGVVTTASPAVSGTTYTITVQSDNYADLSASAAYEAAEP